MKMKLVLAIVVFVILFACVIPDVIPATSLQVILPEQPDRESPFYKPKARRMETQLSRFDLYLWLPKEYNKLLRRAEELMRSILSRPNDRPMGSIDTIHLKADGQFGPIKLRAPMVFLRAREYDAAKASWLFWSQSIIDTNDDKYVVDAWSEPEDHLHIFNDLIVNSDKLSKFKHLGSVHALGIRNPELVLVNIHQGMDSAPPLYIADDYCRPFELQFLLMSRTSFPTHMIVGLNCFDRWVCYDDMGPSYEDFNLQKADFRGDSSIHFAGYVRTHVAVGVAEEGYCGTVPFSGLQKEHID